MNIERKKFEHGYIEYELRGDSCHIHRTFTDPDYRRKGYSDYMLGEFCKWADENDLELSLITCADKTPDKWDVEEGLLRRNARHGFKPEETDGDVYRKDQFRKRKSERNDMSEGTRRRIHKLLSELYTVDHDTHNINQNFWKWFGGSKVRQPDGSPLPLTIYHGGTIVGTVFDLDKVEFGFHFGTQEQASNILDMDYREAGEYRQGSNIGYYFLKIEHPVIIDHDMGYWLDYDRWIREGYLPEQWFVKDENGNFSLPEGERLENLFLEQGHDGIIYQNDVEGEGESYIVFKPTHIKSIMNRGTWDINDPDVMR